MGTWPIYKNLQLILTKTKLSFDKISPRDFYFFSFLFNLYLSSLTWITHNLQATTSFKKKDIEKETQNSESTH